MIFSKIYIYLTVFIVGLAPYNAWSSYGEEGGGVGYFAVALLWALVNASVASAYRLKHHFDGKNKELANKLFKRVTVSSFYGIFIGFFITLCFMGVILILNEIGITVIVSLFQYVGDTNAMIVLFFAATNIASMMYCFTSDDY